MTHNPVEHAPADVEDQTLCIGVAADGTVSTATPLGTLIVQLSGQPGKSDIVMSVQESLGTHPKELDRYPVRDFLALALRVLRSSRTRLQVNPAFVAARLPTHLQRVQRLALAQFVCVNLELMMLVAHGWPQQLPMLFTPV